MIIEGGSRRCSAWFATHLARTDNDQTVTLAEVRGLAGENILGWFRQMEAMALGTRCDNPFYHANINPRDDEHLTDLQWEQAIDTLEHNLGLDGNPRFVVEHEKNGRVHRHVFWSRVDADSNTVVRDSHNYEIHMRTADELEKVFEHERTPRGRGPDGPNPKNHEVFRGQESEIDPYDVKAIATALWRQADSGVAFAAALQEHGLILARGDRRDFVIIDRAGDDYSLARYAGVRTKDIRARMADVDAASLPSVAEARKLARERRDDTTSDAPALDASGHKDKHNANTLFAEVAEELLHAVKQRRKDAEERSPEPEPASPPETAPSPFERIAYELSQAARDVPKRDERALAQPLSEFERVTGEAKAAMREGGEEAWFAAGLYWMAQKLRDKFTSGATARGRTPFDRLTEEVKEAARANGGEPVDPGGQSFWRRSVAFIANAYDNALSWARETAQGFAERLFQSRAAERDQPERER